MARRFLAIVVALVVVFVGIIGLIWFATSDGPTTAQHPGAPGASFEAAGLVSVTGVDLAKAPLGGLPGQEYAIVKDEPAPPPPAGSWEAVAILAPRRGAINLDLEDVQARLSDCFSPAVAGRGGNVLEVKDAAPLKDDTATTLLLELEVAGDQVRIVDAPVESRGQASNGTLSCAQGLLRGKTVPSPGLTPGKHRLRFTLAP